MLSVSPGFLLNDRKSFDGEKTPSWERKENRGDRVDMDPNEGRGIRVGETTVAGF